MDRQQEQNGNPPNPLHGNSGTLPVNETQLRHITRTERSFEILVLPLIENDDVWFTIRVRLPDHPRELLVVDAVNTPRRWRQGNALHKFVIQCCGPNRRVTWDLSGVKASMLHTRGQGRSKGKPPAA
jgi:hypothetical protein